MTKSHPLRDAFLDELRDAYDAEQQLVKELPKLAKASVSKDLRAAFETQLAETQDQIMRLERIFKRLGKKARGGKGTGMKGIIAESRAIMTDDSDTAVMDARLIAVSRRAKHYEVATYGTLVAWAAALGSDDAVELLQQTLAEEEAGDETLSALAADCIDESTSDGTAPDDGEDEEADDEGEGEEEEEEEDEDDEEDDDETGRKF